MDQRLQQAIDAARAGKNYEAQRLLTQLLKDDPEQVQAWFLLSHLVESREKQTAYLGKVLALDPNHQQAQQRLVYLREDAMGSITVANGSPPATMPVVEDSFDLLRQAEGDTLPAWMAEDGSIDITAVSMSAAVETPEPTSLTTDEVPDWLKQPVSQEWIEEQPPKLPAVEKAVSISEVDKAPALAAVTQSPESRPETKLQAVHWNIILIVLVIMMVLVAYFLFRAIQAM